MEGMRNSSAGKSTFTVDFSTSANIGELPLETIRLMYWGEGVCV